MFGFNQGYPLLRTLCENSDIITLQEHWLPPFDLHKLDSISSNFTPYASSAMSETIKYDILKGRPYSGVAFLSEIILPVKLNALIKVSDT